MGLLTLNDFSYFKKYTFYSEKIFYLNAKVKGYSFLY
jgi:hypothetical protein